MTEDSKHLEVTLETQVESVNLAEEMCLRVAEAAGFLAARWSFRSRAVCHGFCRQQNQRLSRQLQADRHRHLRPQSTRNQGFHSKVDYRHSSPHT